MARSLEDKSVDDSVDDICEFLEDQGFPKSVLTSFKGIHLKSCICNLISFRFSFTVAFVFCLYHGHVRFNYGHW